MMSEVAAPKNHIVLRRLRTYSENGDDIFLIPPQVHSLVAIFILVWFTFWSAGGYGLIWKLLVSSVSIDSEFISFLQVWVFVWFVSWCFIGLLLVWVFFGLEEIRTNQRQISQRFKLFGFQWNREFELSQIDDVQFESQFFPALKSLRFIAGENALFLLYKTKTYAIGRGLSISQIYPIQNLLDSSLGNRPRAGYSYDE